MNITNDSEYSALLSEVFSRLADDPDDQLVGIEMHHSDILYVKNHINELGKNPDSEWHGRHYTTREIYDMLMEEDMLEEHHKLPKDRDKKD